MALVREYMKQFPRAELNEKNVRQKYYQGKKLVEMGEDLRGVIERRTWKCARQSSCPI